MSGEKGEKTLSMSIPVLDQETFHGMLDGIVEFLEFGGQFIVLENAKFFTMLSSILRKDISSEKRLRLISDTGTCMKQLLRVADSGETPFLFLNHNRESDLGFLRKVREDERLKNIPVIVVSSEMYEERVAFFCEKGADDIIVVPYNQNTIVEKIMTVLAPPEHLRLYKAGVHYLSRGMLDEAKEVSQELLEKYPMSPKAHELRGEILQTMKKFTRAVKSYETACEMETGRKYLMPRLKLAALFDEMGREMNGKNQWIHDEFLRKELHYLQELEELSPIDVDRRVRRGVLLIGFDSIPEAEIALREAFDLYKENMRTKTDEQRAEAVAMAERIVAASKEKLPELAHEVTVDILSNQDLVDALGPEKQAHMVLGNALALMGMAISAWDPSVFEELFQEAKTEFENVTRLPVTDEIMAEAYFNLGVLYERKGDRLRDSSTGVRGERMTARDAYRLAQQYYMRAVRLDHTLSHAQDRAGQLDVSGPARTYDLRLGKK